MFYEIAIAEILKGAQCFISPSAAVLKLGVSTLFRVANFQKMVAKL
jgi:hypothetical protein